jgi:hypothetical protein
MAINLDAVRQKLSQLQNVTTKQNNLWKPEPGTQQIRIVPYQHNRENPFLELYFHYNFGGKNALSPITYGRPDPIVEFAEKLKSSGNKEDWKMGKKLEPTMRCYAPIIVRGKESEGIKFWGFGKTVYQELLGFIADPDYGDITDPMNGRDITVEFKSKDQTGKDYPETSIRIKPNTSPITTDKGVLEKVGSQPNINDIFKEPSYDDLMKMLQDWLNPDESQNGEASEAKSDSQKQNKKSIESSSTSASSVDDIGAAFDQLFNNK